MLFQKRLNSGVGKCIEASSGDNRRPPQRAESNARDGRNQTENLHSATGDRQCFSIECQASDNSIIWLAVYCSSYAGDRASWYSEVCSQSKRQTLSKCCTSRRQDFCTCRKHKRSCP